MAVDVNRVGAAVADGFERGGTVLTTERPGSPSLPVTRPATYLAWAAILGVMVGFNQLAIEQLHAGQAHSLGAENGPLEDVQLAVMVPALAFFWFAWWKGLGAVRVAGALLALMGTIAVVREIDFKSLNGAHAWLDWLLAHGLQDGLFAIIGLAALFYLFLQRRYFLGLVRLGARWQAWPCVLSVLLLATAELYLDGFTGDTGYFWEELVETNGYFLFAVAAWRHSGLVGDPQLDQPL